MRNCIAGQARPAADLIELQGGHGPGRPEGARRRAVVRHQARSARR